VSDPLQFTVAYVLGVTPGKWAGIWRERMPRRPLILTQASPAEAVAALASGDADVALLRLPVDDASLSVIPLYVENPVVVAPKGHEIEALDSVSLGELEGILEGAWAAVVELVAVNVGVAVMPQSVARALSRKDVVARPVSGATETQVALVWPADRTTDDIEEFIGIVRGRTVNSSRGEPTPPTPTPARKPKAVRPATKRPRRR
jgi:DNA-binding transcriptional LysR family regulator